MRTCTLAGIVYIYCIPNNHMSMTDHDSANEMYLERAQEDVDQFIAECNWTEAIAEAQDLRNRGFSSQADTLMKRILDAQYVYAEDFRFVPFQHPTPPVLEKCWYDGDKGIDIDVLYSETAENAEAVYQAYRAQVNATV